MLLKPKAVLCARERPRRPDTANAVDAQLKSKSVLSARGRQRRPDAKTAGGAQSRPWAQEVANVLKRMCAISVNIWRGPRLGKMGRDALGPRISKCHKENM